MKVVGSTDRAKLPLFPVTRFGRYETRHGLVVDYKMKLECCVGQIRYSDASHISNFIGSRIVESSGRSLGGAVEDVIGPFVNGGIPFNEILDPRSCTEDLLRRFKDAFNAGMDIEYRGNSDAVKSETKWREAKDPQWDTFSLYRIAGSTVDVEFEPEPIKPPFEAEGRLTLTDVLTAPLGTQFEVINRIIGVVQKRFVIREDTTLKIWEDATPSFIFNDDGFLKYTHLGDIGLVPYRHGKWNTSNYTRFAKEE